ncbi:MAG: hypothetical protein ACLQU1_38030 [Bryobacteraceae bacterium]
MKAAESARTAAAALALFAINAFLTLPLFFIDYTREMGSIEAVYIGLARYIGRHFHDLNWFPLWYGGIPYPDTYPPLLHFTVAAVAACGRISPGLAYHAVTASVYALGPVTLFWAAWRLGAGRTAAWLAGLGYSLLSPSCWLVRAIRADAGGWFGPRRLGTLVHYGEGPHLTSLLFLPLAVGMVHVALQKRRPIYYVGAALAVAAVVLSNWIGAFALALALSAYLLAGSCGAGNPGAPSGVPSGVPSGPSRLLAGQAFRRWTNWTHSYWLRAAAIGAYAYALAMPWMTPSTIATIRANAPLVGGRFVPSPRVEAAFAAGLLLLAWGFARLRLAPRLRFGLLFFYGTGFITLGAYYFHAALLPQPERYHLEMDMAFWLAAAGVPAVLPRIARQGIARQRAAFALILLACLPILLHQDRMARDMEKPIAIESTVEYEISHWLGGHLTGRRVFAPGTIGFWMNAFSDTPMLTGGFDNGMRNTFLQDVNYQIYAGDKQEIALDWLRAFGCDAVIGGGAESREFYHPYAHPEKFAGLTELWREGGDVIYAVPRRGGSLAHAVRAGDLPTMRPPSYYTQPLKPYLAALEDPSLPAATFRWRGQSAATITGDLRPEHLLSVQVTFDGGWNARVNGSPRRIWSDTLGQLVVEPRCAGPCTVELVWDGGAETRLARWVSRAAMALGLLSILLWRKRSVSTTTN